jgi:hypothetical protein
MPSAAITRWNTTRLTALDELEQAHGPQAQGARQAHRKLNHHPCQLRSLVDIPRPGCSDFCGSGRSATPSNLGDCK